MKPVKNWRDAWKWFSVQSMTLAAALQGAWLAMPATMQARVPAEWVDALTVAILVLGVVGRLVDQGAEE